MVAILLACAVAGCGSAEPKTDDEICRAQADNDPVVKELILKGTGNPHFLLEGQDQLYAARQDATTACLRSRGVIPPGGVERLKTR